MQTPVSQQPQPACVRRDHAPEHARPFCPKIKREDVAPLSKVVIRHLQHHARIRHQDPRRTIETPYFVHPSQT